MKRNLRSFQLKNYKSFIDTPEINISGLNILLGPNSSGKSNILESLLLLKQSVESKEFGGLVLNGDLVELGEYQDIIHRREEDRNLGYRFNFDISDVYEGKDDYQHLCPICQKEYTYEGYYTNHLEDVHPKFYQNEQVNLEKFENFAQKNPYLEFEYQLDQESRTVVLDRFIYGNPLPLDGLFLSTFEFSRNPDGIEISGRNIHGNTAFSLELDHLGDFDEIRLNNISELSDFYQASFDDIYKKLTQSDMMSDLFLGQTRNDGEPQDYTHLDEEDHDYLDIFNIAKNQEVGEEFSSEFDSTFLGLISRLYKLANQQGLIVDDVIDFLEPMSHVGPLRENPERIYFGTSGDPETVGEKGQNIPNLLFKDKQARNSDLTSKTNEWLQKSGFDCQIDVTEVGVGDLYQLEVIEDGISVNLADTGFGLSQILPIIIECIRLEQKLTSDSTASRWRQVPHVGDHFYYQPTRNDTYLNLIEQPEIHLNPRMHADVSDFFIETVDSGVNLLIETHSEHIITRIQRRVADGTIEDTEEVTIYFVSKDDQASDVDQIDITDTGQFKNWPSGFFEDDFEEAMTILRESMEAKKNR